MVLAQVLAHAMSHQAVPKANTAVRGTEVD